MAVMRPVRHEEGEEFLAIEPFLMHPFGIGVQDGLMGMVVGNVGKRLRVLQNAAGRLLKRNGSGPEILGGAHRRIERVRSASLVAAAWCGSKMPKKVSAVWLRRRG